MTPHDLPASLHPTNGLLHGDENILIVVHGHVHSSPLIISGIGTSIITPKLEGGEWTDVLIRGKDVDLVQGGLADAAGHVTHQQA